jgi:hypothetical protein
MIDTPAPPANELLTLAQVEELTGILPASLRGLILRGRLKATRQVELGHDLQDRRRQSGGGGVWLVSRGDLHSYLQSRTPTGRYRAVSPQYENPEGMDPLARTS